MKNAKLFWSNLTLIDKIILWLVIAWALISFASVSSYGNTAYSLSVAAALVAPLIFIWSFFKVLKSRKLMVKMMLITLALFAIGVSVGTTVEPEQAKKDSAARITAEKKLASEKELKSQLEKQKAQELTSENGVDIGKDDTDSSKRNDGSGESKESSVANAEEQNNATETRSDNTESPSLINKTEPQSIKTTGLEVGATANLHTITKVVDGDTIYTSDLKVRIIGLDTPETKDPRKPVQCFGVEATKRMSELVGNKEVYLEIDSTQDTKDKYGRVLRNVYLKDGTNVAHEMIRGGYGYEYTYNTPYKWQTQYKDAQSYASNNNIGLWAPDACKGKIAEELSATTEGAPVDKQGVLQKPEISAVKRLSGNLIEVNGYGPVNASVSILLADGERHYGETKSNGNFTLTLPSDTSPYGTMTLEAVTGAWLFKSHEPLHGLYYYSLFDKKKSLQSKSYKPVITRVSNDRGDYELRGYYLPDTKLLVKSGDKILSKDTTDDRGIFVFNDVELNGNYANIQLKTFTSAFLSTTKEKEAVLSTYIDTRKRRSYSSLPTTSKIITKTEPIKYASQEVEDPSLPKGQSKVSQEGSDGERTLQYKITYKGDREVNRELVGNIITKQVINKITVKGTYVTPTIPKPIQQSTYSTPAPVASGGVVKLSTNGICHAPGTTYYDKTTNYTSYGSTEACLAAGGRLPRR